MTRVLLALGTSTGGVGRHVHDLAQGLVRHGLEVLIAAPAQVLDQFSMAATGARTHELRVADRPSPRGDAAAVGALRAMAASADVVHAHGLRLGALAALATRRGAPLVVTLHNAAPSGRVAAGIHAALERVVAARADLVLTVSRDLQLRQRKLGARRVEHAVIAAPEAGEITAGRGQVRASLGVRDPMALAVSVGRLATQKRPDLLLDAMVRVERAGGGVLLAIAGDGPLRAELSDRIAAQDLPVRLLGHRHDIADLLAAADVVVSAADWEGQPVWLQEALHQGAAIVTTDAGGTSQVVGDAAVLVPVGDSEALATAIQRVVSDGTARDQLRSASEARSAELPTQQDAVRAAIAAYDSLGVGCGEGAST